MRLHIILRSSLSGCRQASTDDTGQAASRWLAELSSAGEDLGEIAHWILMPMLFGFFTSAFPAALRSRGRRYFQDSSHAARAYPFSTHRVHVQSSFHVTVI